MRIGLLQLNPVVCDFEGNARGIVQACMEASRQGADICVTPELAVIGYPARDLLLREDILEKCMHSVEHIARETYGAGPLLVGSPWSFQGQRGQVFNSACLVSKGRVKKVFCKVLLPEYDVFDEKRYFCAAEAPGVFEFKGKVIGVSICEDAWNDEDFWDSTRDGNDPMQELARQGAEIIINMSASPFGLGKHRIRQAMMGSLALKHKVFFMFCNQVGGFDDLVFPGRSMVIAPDGGVVGRGREFERDVLVMDISSPARKDIPEPDFEAPAEAWQALVLGTRDYVRKSGFSRALLGLSGGIDSALTAAVAAAALGPEKVTGVLMPSPHSSPGSIDDSMQLAENLGIKTLTLPISSLMQGFDQALKDVFAGMQPGVTEENIQSRIRGTLLMALSNKWGDMLLNTGNKSELAVGYCTIYGDMAGSLAVLADVPKTLVYDLARWLNTRGGSIIPEGIIKKQPSAELRPNQKDLDSLPEYDILDEILRLYVEKRASLEEICARGYERDVVQKVMDLVNKSEFKRYQAPPGIKISDVAFGPGRRMPLAARCLI
ncbi:NAD+ synthase [Desulfonatronospira sp.]|uniref:NAD+ synthase n=1 Tax=Desulfonatronospira sp. TaxID=1962951 RepID=UPI0025C0640E|nr:NAD+ synthase [Desulfonatronospira sp.]